MHSIHFSQNCKPHICIHSHTSRVQKGVGSDPSGAVTREYKTRKNNLCMKLQLSATHMDAGVLGAVGTIRWWWPINQILW